MSVVNYPAEWKRVAHTRDGVEYGIRPIRADDLRRDRDFIMGLSPESRYTRMFAAMHEPSAALLEQFVHVDYHSSMAFVAVIGAEEQERIIGVARYAADPKGTVHVSPVVLAAARKDAETLLQELGTSPASLPPTRSG
jgi:acetyltransferase